MDVVKGRRVGGRFPEVTTAKDLLLQLALELHTSKEALFLMSEAGEILVNEQVVTGCCFLYHREEVFLEDKDLAPIGDWKGFKRYPPGDWYAEGFDYSQYQDFTDQYYASISAVEKRLFNCQETVKMHYAVYKMHSYRYRALEYATLSRARAATALLKYTRNYLKSMESAQENISIDSLPHAALAAYKDKVRALASRSDLNPTQSKICQFLQISDIAKLYDNAKSKLEGKIGRTQTLFGRLQDTIRKTKHTLRTRRDTVFNYFEGKSQSEALAREPYLAVTLATARLEYTKFRDLLEKLLKSRSSRSTLISIAEELTKGFDIVELEHEVVRAQDCIAPLKDIVREAEVENDRIRQVLNQAMDNSSLAVCKLNIKLLKRRGKIEKMRADLEKYRKYMEIPDVVIQLGAALELETQRTTATSAAIQAAEELLLDKVRAEHECRQAFQDNYGAFLFPNLFPGFNEATTPLSISPSISSPCSTAAFAQVKSKITTEIADLEKKLLSLSNSLRLSKGLYEQMQREGLGFIQLQHFCARGPKSHSMSRELSSMQMDFLEEASKLAQCL